jgi:prevent-host-death family protein
MARKAGVREARQHLSALLDEVKRGREVEITEHGTVVARLVPATAVRSKPFPGRASFRRGMPALSRRLSDAVLADRKDRW